MKKVVHKLKSNLDQIPLPGFEGITVLNLFQFLKEVFQKGNFALRSAAVSFRFFIALFPTLIFLLSLIPYLPINGVKENLLIMSAELMPTVIYDVFESTVNGLFTRRYNALLSIGFVLSIYYASSGINTLLTAFSQSYQIKLQNSYIKQQILSLGIFLLIILIFLSAIALSIFGNYLASHLQNSGIVFLLDVFQILLQILFVIFGIAILYHFGNPHTHKFKLINAGTLFATIVVFLATKGLSFYFSNFNVYNKIYGSIGSLLISLIWLNVVSYVLIIGFELYTKASEIKKRYSPDLKS
ncbi:YihY/virulence factor BrkB family protein [Bacteroidota bacterium]|nr:YihY/virulence factor BrkB family protein [Bacteroidota bacterium]